MTTLQWTLNRTSPSTSPSMFISSLALDLVEYLRTVAPPVGRVRAFVLWTAGGGAGGGGEGGGALLQHARRDVITGPHTTVRKGHRVQSGAEPALYEPQSPKQSKSKSRNIRNTPS